MKNLLFALMPLLALWSCGAKTDAKNTTENSDMTDPKTEAVTGESTAVAAENDSVKVLIKTTEGNFEVLLYGDTPLHRDNFVKLARSGYYDGTLFHRVINEFMVQAGDPDSRNARPGQQLGSGGPGYQISAEFVYPKRFHKAGALAAARTGDQMNPERKSSGSQFYVVTGKVYSSDELDQMEKQMMQQQFYSLAGQRRAEITQMQQNGDTAGLEALQNELIQQATELARFTPAQREVYTTVGGTPFLDAQYTVFGEVISGMDVVKKIEKVETAPGDRPVNDVKIISMTVEE